MTSSRVATGQKFLEALGKLDKATLLSMITPNFTYSLAPSSIPLPPKMNAEAWGGFLDQTRATIKAYTITIKTTIDCGDAENKVVFWTTGEAHFKDELMDDGLPEDEWRYTGEYMTVFTFGEGGKIEALFEFVDSKGFEKITPLMRRARKNLQQLMEKQK
jgi:ketosteroid isomerase-like protein